MQMDNDDGFQIIDSNYELIDSIRVEETANNKNTVNYQVTIKPAKNQIDMSIVENQYYHLQIKKKGAHYCTVQRRFSEFELIYQILSRKEGGYIFPAFPENGLFAFMKSKVLFSKDEEFVSRRIKMIERFFTKIVNDPIFDPEKCKQLKQFLSPGKQFEARKQIEKINKNVFNFSWGKIKNYFSMGKQSKYTQKQNTLNLIKIQFQNLYGRCRALMDCLKDQFTQNQRFLLNTYTSQYMEEYKKMIEIHDEQQKLNLKALQVFEFELFCENEDMHMASKIFCRINELKDNEDNYGQLKMIQEKLQDRLKKFINQKNTSFSVKESKLKKIVEDIKSVARIQN